MNYIVEDYLMIENNLLIQISFFARVPYLMDVQMDRLIIIDLYRNEFHSSIMHVNYYQFY